MTKQGMTKEQTMMVMTVVLIALFFLVLWLAYR